MITLNQNGELLGEKQLPLFRNAEEIIEEWHRAESIKFKTSGSTGNPKEIRFSKKQVIGSIALSNAFFGLSGMQKVLCPLGLEYVAGKMMLLRALHLGLNLDICMPQQLPQNMTDYDFAPLVPLQLQNILDANYSLPQKILLGGASISSQLLDKIRSNNPNVEIFQGYGMTETLTHIAIRKIHPLYEEAYRPLRGISLSKTRENCLKIWAEHLSPTAISTTDLVEFKADNSFILLGRADLIINSGGHKINPLEVEKLLEPHLDADFFIHGLAHPRYGSQAVLFIEGETAPILENLLNKVPELHPYQRPKEIRMIKKFSRSSAGKIQRQKTVGKL